MIGPFPIIMLYLRGKKRKAKSREKREGKDSHPYNTQKRKKKLDKKKRNGKDGKYSMVNNGGFAYMVDNGDLAPQQWRKYSQVTESRYALSQKET